MRTIIYVFLLIAYLQSSPGTTIHAFTIQSLTVKTRRCNNPRYMSQEDAFSGNKNVYAEKDSILDVRRVESLEKNTRYTVWPVWNGLLIFFLSRIFGDEFGAKLEDAIGGRVGVNMLPYQRTTPWINLFHHRHSFAPWDPLRFFQKAFILPEGFPAHPHRGFVTVTYILKGGFTHRDSLGLKQSYGAEAKHNGKHTQWLSTGAGVLHEEMFESTSSTSWLEPYQVELYQLWLNLPACEKLTRPTICLTGGDDYETPTVDDGSTETVVLAGTYDNVVVDCPIQSLDISLLHVKMKAGSTWQHEIPDDYETAFLYMRTGAASIDGTRIPTHYMAYLGRTGKKLVVESVDGADFLFLAGERLNEPIATTGSMVMNNNAEINQAFADYQMQKMGVPWDHRLSDEEWKAHVNEKPSIYR